ncbi:MAG: EpsG family protein [Saccharofermentans sp.]|nr:EpsG family protein [Saccharofermentans sp.]
MSLVTFCVIGISIVLFFASYQQQVETNVDSGFDNDWKFNIDTKYYVLFALILIFASTVRHGYIDTFAYKEMYINSRDNLVYVNSAPWGVERGWLYLCYYLNYISASPNLILLVASVSIIAVYMFIIKQYSSDPVFSLLVFFCLYYMDTNNGIRQLFAAAICLIGFDLLLNKTIKSTVLFVLLVLFSMIFHQSTYVCFIIAITVLGNPLNKRTVAAIGLGGLFLLFPSYFNSHFAEFFSESKYLGFLDYSNGMSFFRALVVGIIPAAFSAHYLYICQRNNIEIDYKEGVLINFVFVNSMFTLMGLNMQYWARMSFYTSFASVILLPKLFYMSFTNNQRSLIKGLALACYFLFFAYNIYVNIGYGSIGDFYFDVTF